MIEVSPRKMSRVKDIVRFIYTKPEVSSYQQTKTGRYDDTCPEKIAIDLSLF